MRTMSEKEGLEKFGKQWDGEESPLLDAEQIFTWDQTTMTKADSDTAGGDFLKQLDKKLSKFGLEVVRFEFEGDCFSWFIDKKQ